MSLLQGILEISMLYPNKQTKQFPRQLSDMLISNTLLTMALFIYVFLVKDSIKMFAHKPYSLPKDLYLRITGKKETNINIFPNNTYFIIRKLFLEFLYRCYNISGIIIHKVVFGSLKRETTNKLKNPVHIKKELSSKWELYLLLYLNT
jgi:hypothetical protein